ncbi:MAG: mandelate racemase/muconate lactonizing enzyme family protein [Lachnospirales bacterium]
MLNEIKDIKIYEATSEISQPIADSTHNISEISFFVVEVITEENIVGQGYLLSFHYSKNAIKGALIDGKNFILQQGYKVYETVKMKKEFDIESEYFGSLGLQRWVQATLNVAMWDAWAKTLKMPIWKIFGVSTYKIPVYGSGGWLSYSINELIEEVTNYKKSGFKAVKIKVGSESVEEDLERLYKVREAIGNDVKIMMDANQGMTGITALLLAERAKEIGIHWFEEPVLNTDYESYKILKNKTGISLAMGEREYNIESLKALIARNAIDLWQPDIIRIGGVEEWRNSAALANSYHIPVLPHYYKDYDVPLLATVPNGYGAESFDWIDGIIDNKMVVEDGYAQLRQGDGWGFNFKKEFLKEIYV